MVEAFLTVLAQEPRFRDIPVAVIGETPPEFADALPNIEHVNADPTRLVTRIIPLVRMRAFEARLKRMLKSLDTDGVFDPQSGLLTRDSFWHDLKIAINEAADRIMADFGKYKHYVTEQTKGRLAPHEMSDHFVRYTHYVVYDEKRFEQVYEWMRSWGLASGKADHASVVATF